MVPITKVSNFFRRVKRAPWILGQRLVQSPSSIDSAVSDLFIWVCDKEWNTFFELIDTFGLFENEPAHVTFHIYDKNGKTLDKHDIELNIHNKITIDVSNLLPKNSGNYGTFSVFHKSTPTSIFQNNSFISERGYTGYQYKSSSLLGFVHGNHDAIAYNRTTRETELLSSSSFFRRDFNLQYLFESEPKYFIGIVNNSRVDQNIKLRLVNNKEQSRVMHYNEFKLKPKGVHFCTLQLNNGEKGRAIINSKLIMSRPIVIKIIGKNMDIFHG